MTLFVGSTINISADHDYKWVRPNDVKDGPYRCNLDLMYTGPVGSVAKGVSIDVVPSPDDGGHPGIVFNCKGRLSDDRWQTLEPQNNAPTINPAWVRGRGVIFHKDGSIQYERWFHQPGGANNECGHVVDTIPGNWKSYGAITVDCTTNPDGTGIMAVYGTSGLGGTVQALLHSWTFAPTETINGVQRSIPTGIYAAAFALGAGNSIAVRPRGLYN